MGFAQGIKKAAHYVGRFCFGAVIIAAFLMDCTTCPTVENNPSRFSVSLPAINNPEHS
jgi:hypothetical protein